MHTPKSNPFFKTLLSFFLFLFLGTSLAFTQTDSLRLFSFQELNFHSELEKTAMQCTENPQTCNYFQMALATDPAMLNTDFEFYQKEFYSFLGQLKAHKNFGKKPKAQIKFIFNSIHDKYFNLYQANPLFSEIFTKGHFNCLTASVLFAFAFDYLEIPYETILLTNHVYLLAYPKQTSIVVETTNPLKGAQIVIDPREKGKIVRALVDMKLITENELREKGVERIFTEIYLAQATPNLIQLIGALYYNQSIEHMEYLRSIEAYGCLKKSDFLFPRKPTVGLLMYHSSMILSRSEHMNPETYRVLAEMDRFPAFKIHANEIVESANELLKNALNSSKPSFADTAFAILQDGLTDQNIKNSVKINFYISKAYPAIMERKYKVALETIAIALSDLPNETTLTDLFANLALNYVVDFRPSPDDKLKNIASYAAQFPALNENKHFSTAYQVAYIRKMDEHISARNLKLFEETRREFEKMFPAENHKFIFEALVEMEALYSRAAMFYFRDNKTAASRAVLNSGLLYYPESFELKHKLNALR